MMRRRFSKRPADDSLSLTYSRGAWGCAGSSLTGQEIAERWRRLIGLLALLSAAPAAAEKRVALVVGNSAYQYITKLDNPSHDAVLMADTLSGLGFTLIGGRAQLDLDKAGLDTAVQNFGRLVQGADVALFYYAGHGVQVSGSTAISRSPAPVVFPAAAVPERSGDRTDVSERGQCRNSEEPFVCNGFFAPDG